MDTGKIDNQTGVSGTATPKAQPPPPRFKRPMPTFAPFKEVEATRPDFDPSLQWRVTKTIDPDWKVGSGPNDTKESEGKEWVVLDPNDTARDPIDNYTLMISGFTPRPISLLSTTSKDGMDNLAPFSYCTIVNHDPILIVVGFSPTIKNSFQNIIDTGEATWNSFSESYIEAANFSCVDAPHGVSEWPLTGLHKGETKVVKPKRVAEAVFSVECKLRSHEIFKNWEGKPTGGFCLLEGVMMHIRKDAFTNEDQNEIDQGVLKSVSRLGNITYARTLEGIQIPRAVYGQLTEEEKKLIQ